MRVLVVVNPRSTSAGTARRHGVVEALRSGLRALGSGEPDVAVVETNARGHARDLGAHAAAEGLDVVVTVGGDGTVNEVVTGMLGADPRPHAEGGLPLLATVPAGNANVFARALGLSHTPARAVAELVDGLRSGRSRRVGLGRVHGSGPDVEVDRWFTFSAGLGFDAEVIRDVERRREDGARATAALYARAAARQIVLPGDRARPPLVIEHAGRDLPPVHAVIVSNTTPWTYVGRLPLQPTPEASFDAGLDVFGLRRLGVATTLLHLARFALRPRPAEGRWGVGLHDAECVEVRAAKPVDAHVDGEYLGRLTQARFTAVPSAISVVETRVAHVTARHD